MLKSQGMDRRFPFSSSSKYGGFTLIECLVSLSVLSLIFLLLSGVFHQSQVMNQRIQGRQELEWHVFLIQLENQFQLGTLKSVKKGELLFERKEEYKGEEVTFSIKWSKSTASVYLSDNGGMERLLTQVRQLNFQQAGADVFFTVTFIDGEEKIGKWTIP
ncbi:competence type IV pilus minor pilin ComGF [Enterococcus sp. LJL98]